MGNMMPPLSAMTRLPGKGTFTVDPWWVAIEDAQNDMWMAYMEARAVTFADPHGRKRERFTILGINHRLLRDRHGEVVLILKVDGLGMLVKGEMPETILRRMPGRPVRDVVAHAGLDPDAIITEAEGLTGMFRLTFDRMASVYVEGDD